MEGVVSANGEAAPCMGANGSEEAGEALANQRRGEEPAAANGGDPPQGLSNEEKRSCGSANQDTGQREVTNDSKEPQPANEDTAHKASTNEDTARKSLTNENPTTPAANQNAATQAPTNQSTAPGATTNKNNTRQAPPTQDPTNDLTAPPAAANQDPWDWSLEEAWLRTPEEEGLEAWGAELDDSEAELEDSEAELGTLGAELNCCREGFDTQGAEPDCCGEGFEALWAEPSTDHAHLWQPSPDGAWSKLVVLAGHGLARPGPGSRCRVLLAPPPSVPSPRWGAVATAATIGRWATVRLGSAEGRWAAAVDAILESMAGGELAWLRAGGAVLAVRLARFTPAPPFWATPVATRWKSVAADHARATELLARGYHAAAGRVFGRALRQAVVAAGPPPLAAEAAELKAELHAGLALAQLRLGLPAAAATNAGKALALRPAHLEARYRRGVAQAAMMDLEAAAQDLVAVLRARPGHAGARQELARVRSAARRRDEWLGARLGRLFA